MSEQTAAHSDNNSLPGRQVWSDPINREQKSVRWNLSRVVIDTGRLLPPE